MNFGSNNIYIKQITWKNILETIYIYMKGKNYSFLKSFLNHNIYIIFTIWTLIYYKLKIQNKYNEKENCFYFLFNYQIIIYKYL